MANQTDNRTNVVIAFVPAARDTGYWTAQRAFGNLAAAAAVNSNFPPAFSEGAQTSDHLLDFLYGLTRQAH